MERIQAAIERARQRRASVRGEPAPPAAAPPPDARAAIDAVWAALPAFGLREAHLEANRIVVHQGGAASAPFDVMRTKLLLQMRTNQWRRLAITSPTNDCGKTTVAANLALCLARQAEIRVMLVDLDLRRPALLAALGISHDLDIARILSGRGAPEAQFLRIGANLAVTGNSRAADRSAELLQGVQAAEVLDRIEAQFAPDVMIFDMPPMLMADDTIGFLDQVDCALLVGAAEQSTREEIQKCAGELEARSNSLGVVLNKCRFRAGAQDYSAGY
jgi:protein-tyrosine kinase